MAEDRRVSFRALSGLVLSLVFVLPLYWAFIASLGEPGAPPPVSIAWWPADPHWENYIRIFEIVDLATYTINSLFVVLLAVPLTILTASIGGFALSQLSPSSRDPLVYLGFGMLLIPSAAVWLFRFQLLVWLNLLNSLWALILPAFAASSPLFVLLFYWNYRRVPSEMIDAVRLDGADAVTVWRRIAWPLSMPTIIGVGVLTFVMYWSDFVSPVLYLFLPGRYTLPVGLQLISQVGSTNWPILMAAAVYMTMPVLLFFIVLQRYFLSDLSIGGVFERND